MAVVATTLAVLGVSLAAIGLYGVLTNVVAAELRETAIRAALGAAPGSIASAVMRRGLLPALAGALAGVAGAVAIGRLLESHLFGLSPLDSRAYVFSVGVMLAVAATACLPSAWRASRVSIAETLRAD